LGFFGVFWLCLCLLGVWFGVIIEASVRSWNLNGWDVEEGLVIRRVDQTRERVVFYRRGRLSHYHYFWALGSPSGAPSERLGQVKRKPSVVLKQAAGWPWPRCPSDVRMVIWVLTGGGRAWICWVAVWAVSGDVAGRARADLRNDSDLGRPVGRVGHSFGLFSTGSQGTFDNTGVSD